MFVHTCICTGTERMFVYTFALVLQQDETSFMSLMWQVIITIMYIYHALINALSAHMIHINLNMIFYTHANHSPTKTIYIKYY